MKTIKYSASGKLLLFGEYLVLRGAKCLAFPLSFGQELEIHPENEKGILIRSFEFENCWLEILLSKELKIIRSNDTEKAKIIQKLFSLIKEKKPDLFLRDIYLKFRLNFLRHLGLGSSSTLISLLSQWSGFDPYYLLEKSFGGSGYDIAAATSAGPFIYSANNKIERHFVLPESITRHLLFVYLGKKQKSSKEVAAFKNKKTTGQQIDEMNRIVTKAARCHDIEVWEDLMNESEALLSLILKEDPAKEKYFGDYPYSIKSLGAWGGDFIMASCRNIDEAENYFLQKQKHPIFTYGELIK